MNDLTLRPKGFLGFIALATLMIGAIAGLALLQVITVEPINQSIQATPTYWHQFVALSGFLLPIVVRILGRKQALVRRIFNAYLLVLIAQVITELVLAPHFPNGLVGVIGALYSSFRLAQLCQGQRLAADSTEVGPWLRYFLFFLLGIWAINLARLAG